MADIEITDAPGVWTVRSTDGVLVESRNAKALREGSRAPVIYFPRADVAMALLERSDTTTTCPHKGVANYYSYAGASAPIADVAWTYENVTQDAAKAIEGYLAFYDDKLTVERV